jgi:putative tryptophan/tyrosine transport system substrate-binding protein
VTSAAMRRREFITLLGGAVTWPLAAGAQQHERLRRVGVVMAYAESDPNGQLQVAAFRQQLQKLGWMEGSNIQIDFRYAADDPARIRALAMELLAPGLDLMVSNSNFVTTILQSEVHSIPLLFVSVSDPIGSGFVKDLARPGGNITGFANFQPSMGGKWLEKLREIAPQVERVGLMLRPEPPNIGYLRSAEAAARSFKINLVGLEAQSSSEIERVVATFAGEPQGGLIIAPNVVNFAHSDLIVALAARYRLPAIYPFAFYAKQGGLISYGFDAADQFRQGAVYADKILRGAKPADLPVQHPTKFELVINLKAAKALGLDVSWQLQQLADDVIE